MTGQAYDYPNSKMWMLTAIEASYDLQHLIGRERHCQFMELVWPGASFDNCTWEQITTAIGDATAQALIYGVRDVTKLVEHAKSSIAEIENHV